MNHPSEATESPIEIQLRVLRTTLGDDLVRDLEDSVAPNRGMSSAGRPSKSAGAYPVRVTTGFDTSDAKSGESSQRP